MDDDDDGNCDDTNDLQSSADSEPAADTKSPGHCWQDASDVPPVEFL
jgi:hypothetical protein